MYDLRVLGKILLRQASQDENIGRLLLLLLLLLLGGCFVQLLLFEAAAADDAAAVGEIRMLACGRNHGSR